MYRLEGGRIAERYVVRDDLAHAAAPGGLPPPGTPG